MSCSDNLNNSNLEYIMKDSVIVPDDISITSDISYQEDPYNNVDIQDYDVVKKYLEEMNTTVDESMYEDYMYAIECRDNFIDPQENLADDVIIRDNITCYHVWKKFNNTIKTLYQ